MFGDRDWYHKMYLPDQIGAFHLTGKIKCFQERNQSLNTIFFNHGMILQLPSEQWTRSACGIEQCGMLGGNIRLILS